MMIYPQYVVLTVTRVAMRNPKNPKHATANILNPPVRQLFVLPLMLSKSQYSDHAEIENADGRLLTLAEHFEDVVNAINDASLATMAVARPARREQVSTGAVHPGYQDSPLKRIAEEMRAGTANFVPPGDAEMRAAEGAKHQDEFIDPGKCEHGNAHGSFCPFCPDKVSSPLWGDFVQTDGENVGLPIAPRAGARDLLIGDLRIIKMDGDRWWIEVARLPVGGGNPEGVFVEWERAGVPSELMPLYDTREAAQTAVKLAGYSRRLWEE